MKKLFGFLLALFFLSALSACSKNNNKRAGVCYCEFVKGADQEYDLSHLSKQEQIDQCNTHSANATKFGGGCKLY